MQFELFRAKEVKSKAQSEQTASERQDKKRSLTIKNYKIVTQMNEMSARDSVNLNQSVKELSLF